jgi:hypothetical protein
LYIPHGGYVPKDPTIYVFEGQALLRKLEFSSFEIVSNSTMGKIFAL